MQRLPGGQYIVCLAKPPLFTVERPKYLPHFCKVRLVMCLRTDAAWQLSRLVDLALRTFSCQNLLPGFSSYGTSATIFCVPSYKVGGTSVWFHCVHSCGWVTEDCWLFERGIGDLLIFKGAFFSGLFKRRFERTITAGSAINFVPRAVISLAFRVWTWTWCFVPDEDVHATVYKNVFL